MPISMRLEDHKRAGKSQRITVRPAAVIPSTQQPAEISTIFTIPATNEGRKMQFLVDTGADVSVLPASKFRGDPTTTNRQLLSANQSVIHAFGSRTLAFSIDGLHKLYHWTFT